MLPWMTAEEAVRLVKTDDRVFVHGSAATPLTLLRALLARPGQAVAKERLSEVVFAGETEVQADAIEAGCPDCGVVSDRVHAWCRQRVKDIPHAGRVEVVVVKPRLVCAERACSRRTFTQTTSELPRRARCTTRLRQALLTAVIDQGQPVAQVAKTHQVAWWTTQKPGNAAVVVLPDVDDLHVKHLGIDEHRCRRVRWHRDPDTSAWRRVVSLFGPQARRS